MLWGSSIIGVSWCRKRRQGLFLGKSKTVDTEEAKEGYNCYFTGKWSRETSFKVSGKMAYISGQVLKNGNPISGAKVTLIKQFNIKNIADIALWLKADTGVIKDASGNVSEWQDQSGNNNHATQTDPTHKPVLLDNRYNGKPAIYFDGNNKYLQLPGDFFRNIPALDIFVVVSHAVPLPDTRQTYIIGTLTGSNWRVQFRSNETSFLNLVIGGQRLDSGSWYGIDSNNIYEAQQRYIHNGIIDFVNGRLAIYFDQLFDIENTSLSRWR